MQIVNRSRWIYEQQQAFLEALNSSQRRQTKFQVQRMFFCSREILGEIDRDIGLLNDYANFLDVAEIYDDT